MTVFLDTVGLIAVWDEDDQWHPAANPCLAELRAQQGDFVTTAFVLLECGNAAARKPYRSAPSRLRKQMEQQGKLILPTIADWETAWDNYGNGEADVAGIVDHVSFVVMRRLGIAKAFTNDRHFRAAGFETLF
jgi:predicted nucleic acid-binding protein